MSLIKLSKAFARQPRSWILAEMASALMVIGVLDFVTTYNFRLLPFYAGPIFVVGWFFGKRLGVATAVVSTVIWWSSNWFNGDPDLHTWVWAWEIARHAGSFLLVAWTASALRAKSDMAAARIALLEHSRQLEREIINISEESQRRIGQDLHDGVCQVLAALSCSAASLRTDLENRSLPAEANTAAELAHLLQAAVVETRDLARSLVPAHINEVGLGAALEALAQSVTRLHRVNCTFESRGRETPGAEDVSIHLYRIAQEAVSNAIKHGKAKNIRLSLLQAADRWTLRITDDGSGISATPPKSGMGLAVMAYRARVTGGDLALERPAAGGTRVTCTMPAKEREPQDVAA
jgi:signal transduction histidine kinase